MFNIDAIIKERFSLLATSFDIKIVGSSPRRTPDGGARVPNQWVYTARQVVVEKDGRYKDLPYELGWHGTAFNTLEFNNTETGIQGSGDNVDNLPDGLAPIGPGAVIQGAYRRMSEEGQIHVLFSAPNNPSGRCIRE